MTSKRQKAREEGWRQRVGERLAAAPDDKGRAQVWWDELRRRTDSLPEHDQEQIWLEVAAFIRRAATAGDRR